MCSSVPIAANWHDSHPVPFLTWLHACFPSISIAQVHSKLVNFMTPVELEAPQFAAQLFSNLFGGAGSRAGKR